MVRLLSSPPGHPPRSITPEDLTDRRERDREIVNYIVEKGREQVSPTQAAEGVASMSLAELVMIEIEMREKRPIRYQFEWSPYNGSEGGPTPREWRDDYHVDGDCWGKTSLLPHQFR